MSSRKTAKAKVETALKQARDGDLSLRAECSLAFRAWERAGGTSLQDAAVEVEAGALMAAEAEWNIHRLRVILEERPVIV